MSKKRKIIFILFLFLLFIISFLFYFCTPKAQAVNADTPKLQIPDLNVNFSAKVCNPDPATGKTVCSIAWIGEYIAAIYKYAIGIVGILAAVVLMVGGVIWIMAGGSATAIGEAKAWIGAAIAGLVIALTSYLILYQVNPALTIFKPLRIAQVEKPPEIKAYAGLCRWTEWNQAVTGPYKCDDGWEEKAGSCAGQQPSSSYVCCCQIFGGTTMCKANAPSPDYCQACNNCEISTIPNCKESPCLVNKDLENKLKTLYAQNTNWRISEPWPPTVPHDSICHKIGTCVDITIVSPPATGTICDAVNSLVNQAKTIFGASKVLNEYANCNGTTYNTTTGYNIHLSL